MAGTVVADTIQAASTSTLVLKNGVASTPPTVQDSAGTEIGTFCRAWVNFNGTGAVAIRSSFNVRDITDNGTGDYTVNFQTATPMPDANYATVATVLYGTIGNKGGVEVDSTGSNPTTSATRLRTYTSSTTAADCNSVYVAIFR